MDRSSAKISGAPARILVFSLLYLLLLPGAAVAAAVVRLANHANGAMIPVPPGKGLIVDFTGTTLLDDPTIDMVVIQLQMDGRSDYYSADLTPPRLLYPLNAATLRPHASPPFPGLGFGGASYLLVGREPSPGSLDRGIFDAHWKIYLLVR